MKYDVAELESFLANLTAVPAGMIHERLWAYNRFPKDPYIIKCTFTPGTGWDLRESEAHQFIAILGGHVKNILRQPRELTDYRDLVWIEFEVV